MEKIKEKHKLSKRKLNELKRKEEDLIKMKNGKEKSQERFMNK